MNECMNVWMDGCVCMCVCVRVCACGSVWVCEISTCWTGMTFCFCAFDLENTVE